MSSYHEAVKRVLSEFNKFLEVTLQSENLSTAAENERSKIVKLLQKLFADYSSLAPSSGDEGSISSTKDAVSGSLDECRNTVDSSHGSEEDSYADNIPDTTVKALSESSKMGYLDRKQEILFTSSWQKRYCVLFKNIFYIFKKPTDKKQQGAFFVTGYDVRDAPQFVKDDKKKECCFELVCPGKKSYQFLCESKEDLKSWREVLQVAAAASNQSVIAEGEDIYEEFNEASVKPPANTVTSVVKEDEVYDDAATEVPAVAPNLGISPASSDRNKNVKGKPEILEDDEIYEFVDPDASPSPFNKTDTTLINKKSVTPVPAHMPKLPESSAALVLPRREDPLPPLPSHRGQDPPRLPQRTQEPTPVPPPLPPGRTLPPPPKDPLPAVPQPPKKTVSPSIGKILHPSEDFENLFYGNWDCTGCTENELSFKRGQILHIISRDLDEDDWWVGVLDDKIGLVPKTYLRPAYELVK